MFTVALKRQLTKRLGVYANWAFTDNGPAAHYDLGAGGRAVTTDCHDAFDSTGGLVVQSTLLDGRQADGIFSRDELEALRRPRLVLLGQATRRGCIKIGVAAPQFFEAGAGCIKSFDDTAFQIGEESRAGVFCARLGLIV